MNTFKVGSFVDHVPVIDHVPHMPIFIKINTLIPTNRKVSFSSRRCHFSVGILAWLGDRVCKLYLWSSYAHLSMPFSTEKKYLAKMSSIWIQALYYLWIVHFHIDLPKLYLHILFRWFLFGNTSGIFQIRARPIHNSTDLI